MDEPAGMPNVEPTPPRLDALPCRNIEWHDDYGDEMRCDAQQGEPCTWIDREDERHPLREGCCHSERWQDRYASDAWTDYLADWTAWQQASRPAVHGVRGRRRASVLANLMWLADRARAAGHVSSGWAVWYLAEYEAGNGAAFTDAATAEMASSRDLQIPRLASASLKETTRRAVASLIKEGLLEEAPRRRATSGRYVRVLLTADERAREDEQKAAYEAEQKAAHEAEQQRLLASLGGRACRKCGDPEHTKGTRLCRQHMAEAMAEDAAWDALSEQQRATWVADALAHMDDA